MFNVWNRSNYGTKYGPDPSSRYGTGVWNGGMEQGYGTGVVLDLAPGLIS